MNGFTNAILTLLLGWLRSLFSTLWTLLGSKGGNAVVTFLRANWKTLFLILCVGGFVVDRVIYLLRWRPYYVWQARRARRRRGWEDEPAEYGGQPNGEAGDAPLQAYAYNSQHTATGGMLYQPMPTARYRPHTSQQHSAPTYRYTPLPRRHTDSYPADRPYAQGATQPYGQPDPLPRGALGEPLTYMPGASYAPTAAYQPQAYQPPQEAEPFDGEPRFDDDLAGWNTPAPAYDGFAPRLSPEYNPAYGMDTSFGVPQPEPGHLHHMHDAYAPVTMPEQRYAPPPDVPAPIPEGGAHFDAAVPDHPGLDAETFQQNIGLTGDPALGTDRRADAAYAGFTPFAAVAPQEGPLSKPRGLGALAKKARSLVSGEDERNPRTIRDLQPAADVKNAFRAPVYPQKPPGSEDDA